MPNDPRIKNIMKQTLVYKYDHNSKKEVYPAHPMVQSWLFNEATEDEAILANQMAVIAEKNGISVNHLQHIFPAVLRMLKDKSVWSE